MAGFIQTSGDGKVKFRETPIFRDGMTFTITSAVTGIWQNDQGGTINKDGSNSIQFQTSVNEPINLNRFLNRKRVVYSDKGRASILYDCEFHDELKTFIETKIGRQAGDTRFLNGTAKQVADKLLEFFKDRTIECVEHKDVFFKEVKDGVERLEAPYSPVLTFRFK